MSDLIITVNGVELEASWTEENPETRAALEAALPIEGRGSRWGDELYFETEVDVPLERGKEVVPVGAVAYWPRGNALCIFWGATPASRDGEPRASSPVSVVARIGDVSSLDGLKGGADVRVERG